MGVNTGYRTAAIRLFLVYELQQLRHPRAQPTLHLCSSGSAIQDMLPHEKPVCPLLQVFAAYKAPIVSPPMPASSSFRASVNYAAEEGYLTPPASPLWS